MRKVKSKWKQRKYVMQLGRTLPQIKRMITDIAYECAVVGLELHAGKTKIQHNNISYGSRVRKTLVNDMDTEVVEATLNTMYLGWALSLTDVHDTKLRHRLRKA